MTKKTFFVGLAAVLFVLLIIGSVQAGPATDRQIRQQTRIHQGIVSGSLTVGEAFALEREQARISRFKRCAWGDGVLTRPERLRLTNMQNRASRHIYRMKHNPWRR